MHRGDFFGQGTIERPFEKAAAEKSIAQGTIEYLVIMAVVIVIGLLVVGLASTFFDPAKGINVGIGDIKNKTSGSIIIVDAVSDLEGDALVILKGLPGENNVITRIVACGVDLDFDSKTLVDVERFALDSAVGCACLVPGESVTTSAIIYYTTLNGLSKSVIIESTFDCVGDVNNDVSGVTQPEVTSNVVPVVSLSLPVDGNSTSETRISFVFVPSDSDGTISDCNLNVTGTMDVNNISTVLEGVNNTIDYTLSAGSYDWNVSCTDNNGSTTTSDTRSLVISGVVSEIWFGSGNEGDPFVITDCNELQQIDTNLTAYYVLGTDIDCSETSTWNDDNGFSTIGSYEVGTTFTGQLDGDNHTVSNLKIYSVVPEFKILAPIYTCDNAVIKNIGFVDINIISYNSGTPHQAGAAGICGYLRNNSLITDSYVTGYLKSGGVGGLAIGIVSGSVKRSYFDGNIVSYDTAGGIASTSSGLIENCYTKGHFSELAAADYYGNVGGILASASSPNCIIQSSYSTASVTGDYKEGGLVGQVVCKVYNSFSRGAVSSTTYVGGNFGFNQTPYDSTNNYWDIYTSGRSTGGCAQGEAGGCECVAPMCNGVNSGNSQPTYFYYNTNSPMDDGNWTWGADANWNICAGTGLPWLSWEDRTC